MCVDSQTRSNPEDYDSDIKVNDVCKSAVCKHFSTEQCITFHSSGISKCKMIKV